MDQGARSGETKEERLLRAPCTRSSRGQPNPLRYPRCVAPSLLFVRTYASRLSQQPVSQGSPRRDSAARASLAHATGRPVSA